MPHCGCQRPSTPSVGAAARPAATATARALETATTAAAVALATAAAMAATAEATAAARRRRRATAAASTRAAARHRVAWAAAPRRPPPACTCLLPASTSSAQRRWVGCCAVRQLKDGMPGLRQLSARCRLLMAAKSRRNHVASITAIKNIRVQHASQVTVADRLCPRVLVRGARNSANKLQKAICGRCRSWSASSKSMGG